MQCKGWLNKTNWINFDWFCQYICYTFFLWNCTGMNTDNCRPQFAQATVWFHQATGHYLISIVEQYLCRRMTSLWGNELKCIIQTPKHGLNCTHFKWQLLPAYRAHFLWNCIVMDTNNLESTLVHVMAWCNQTIRHFVWRDICGPFY